ncbi:OsmC family protein [Tropicimonas sp. IMCC6043]|uniref:OsmC family protein n=1 Tax=Tropicimonas sp. IMCC6043 TaxID=2510645 RepID=UPI00101B92D9|nr:OsmC family protein [Tropicimonas sp. IMCC6043]RYH06137.1 OsmC family peroxiredoxin [Tropicimonas sp. IMCC6043]
MYETNVQEIDQPTVVNGIDVDALGKTLAAIREDPDLGVSQFRATNRWIGGNHNRTTVTSFYGAKQDIAHAKAFEMDADEPPILAGNDLAANPVEHLLHALAACVTTSMVAHAASRGIPINSVESVVEGDIDLRGYLGLANDVPRGYTALRVKFTVDAEPRYLKRLEDLSKFSPVFNTILNGAQVDISVEPA